MDGEQIAGAAGFSLEDGAFQVFEADAVVVAMGSQNFDIVEMWCGTGNGIRAAYLAGAEMRNVEFGNMCDFARVDPRGWLYYGAHGAAHTAHDHLLNAKGENISQKYRPGLHTSMDPVAALAWYKETLAGNGPISVDISEFSGKAFFKFHPKAFALHELAKEKADYPASDKFEVVPGFIGEMSCIKVDTQMETTVPGLFAAGNSAGSGSARGGAVPTPPSKMHGMGIMNAVLHGHQGRPGRGRAREGPARARCQARVSQSRTESRSRSGCSPPRSNGGRAAAGLHPQDAGRGGAGGLQRHQDRELVCRRRWRRCSPRRRICPGSRQGTCMSWPGAWTLRAWPWRPRCSTGPRWLARSRAGSICARTSPSGMTPTG